LARLVSAKEVKVTRLRALTRPGRGGGLLLLVVPFGFAAVILWPQPYRVTRDNFKRIDKGMSRARVESVLGRPGDYRSGPTDEWWNPDFDPSTGKPLLDPITGRPFFPADRCWWADAGLIRVDFDDSGFVSEYYYCDLKMAQQSPFENLLWRVKRQWRRWFQAELPVRGTRRRLTARSTNRLLGGTN
jgi:hypothetical protein